MRYTKGPWEVVPTVLSDRQILFGVAPLQEYHIGTFISGSRSGLEIFRANLSLMRYSPLMFDLLNQLHDELSAKTTDVKRITRLKKECRRLLEAVRSVDQKKMQQGA